MGDRQNEIVVVEIAGEHGADRLLIVDDRRWGGAPGKRDAIGCRAAPATRPAAAHRLRDRRHVDAELFRLPLHVGVERRRRFDAEPATAASRPRSDRFWFGAELDELIDELLRRV